MHYRDHVACADAMTLAMALAWRLILLDKVQNVAVRTKYTAHATPDSYVSFSYDQRTLVSYFSVLL